MSDETKFRKTLIMVVAAAAMGLLSKTALATPQEYCIAYASEFADKKEGFSADMSARTDEMWQGSYNKTFASCMERYAAMPAIASADSIGEPRKSKLAKKRGAKSTGSTSRPRKAAQKRTKPVGQTSEAKPSNRAASSVRTGSLAKSKESLCRRAQADKKGGFRIRDCG